MDGSVVTPSGKCTPVRNRVCACFRIAGAVTGSFIRASAVAATVLLAGGCSFNFSQKPDADLSECRSVSELLSRYSVEEPRASLYIPVPSRQEVGRLPEPALDMTPEVKHHMRVMGGSRSRFIENVVDQRDRDYPLLAQIFRDEGVPEVMLNLAMVESAYRIEARSPVGAVGMWQFMKSTARIYGLKVDHTDDRKDPILSTIAAARHLRDLFNQYGDWHLALAAYNAGTGAVDRILSRSSHRDFWKLARSGQFSRQTAEFVPKFIATSLLINSVLAERNTPDTTNQYASLGVVSRQ